MLQIKRAGHSTLTTPDIERMIDYFTRIVGLSLAAREKNSAILATQSALEAIVQDDGQGDHEQDEKVGECGATHRSAAQSGSVGAGAAFGF
jgi:catechol 2,3-dioxygenase-like lactoylglutathione lyase family enzyme